MPQRKNLLEKMKNNPIGFKIVQCRALANSYGVISRWGKNHHCIFDFGKVFWPIPPSASKEGIKPFYIKKFIKLLENHSATKTP